MLREEPEIVSHSEVESEPAEVLISVGGFTVPAAPEIAPFPEEEPVPVPETEPSAGLYAIEAADQPIDDEQWGVPFTLGKSVKKSKKGKRGI
jgi:hypothetical protein